MKDALGEIVQPGCTICYPSRKRAKLWLRVLRVQRVDGDRITGLNQNGRAVTITRPEGENLIVAKGAAL